MRKAHLVLPCLFGLLIGSCFQMSAQVGTCSGCLDATFGTGGNGLVVTNGPAESLTLALETLTVTQNGVTVPVQKIVAGVGSVNASGTLTFGVNRYNMDGTVDTTFNGNPSRTIPAAMHGLAVQSDGKILLVGDTTAGEVVRLNTDGSLDATFGSGGVVSFPASKQSANQAHAVLVQDDGKIVVAGNAGATPTVWRLTTGGALDTTFGSGSSGAAPLVNPDSPRAVALETVNGQQMIVVAGFTRITTKGKTGHDVFAVGRLNSSGQVDTSFNGGSVLHDFAGQESLIMSLAVDSSNRIVAAGYANLASGGSEVAVSRYNADGSADVTFGTNGYSTFSMLSKSSDGWAVALQADGKIALGGFSTASSGPTQMAVARLTTTGTLDGNFATGGYAIVGFSPFGETGGYGYSVLVQPDGKILVGGPVTPVGGLGLARYWP